MNESAINRLKLMREKLNQQGGGKRGGDGAVFPFWDVKVGSSVGLRFLPDKNQNNPFMWMEKQTFRWSFADPKNPQAKVNVTLPCREMYDGPKSCPIVNELRPMYNTGNERDAEAARPFWPKKVYIYQGFVRSSQIQEESVPENPIRIFMVNKKVHTKIKESILSNDPQTAFQISPDDFERGRDFVVKKTKQGKYDNYDQSQWAFAETPLTEDELASIEKYGLWDLATRLPKRPSDEAFAVMLEMFHAAQAGEAWNSAWERHFKPQSGAAFSRNDDEVDHEPTPEPGAEPAPPTDATSRLRAVKPQGPAQEPAKPHVHEDVIAPQVKAAGPNSGKDVMERLKALRAKTA